MFQSFAALVMLQTMGVFTSDGVTAPPEIKTKGAPASVVNTVFIVALLVAAITGS